MFKRLEADVGRRIGITFEGADVVAMDGELVAASLLAAGISALRQSAASGQKRAPYCMMGACYDCLVEIDGRVVQACMTPARDGMSVRRPARVHPEGAHGESE